MCCGLFAPTHNSISNVVVSVTIHVNVCVFIHVHVHVCVCVAMCLQCVYNEIVGMHVCKDTCQHQEDGEASLRKAVSLCLSLSSVFFFSLSPCDVVCVVVVCWSCVLIEPTGSQFSPKFPSV